MNLDPINATVLVLNGSMMLCLALVIILGRRRLKARKRRKAGQAVTLLTEPRQCLLGLRRIAAAPHGYHLPAITREDRL